MKGGYAREGDKPLGSRGYGGSPGLRERLETLVERLGGCFRRRCPRRKRSQRSMEDSSAFHSDREARE